MTDLTIESARQLEGRELVAAVVMYVFGSDLRTIWLLPEITNDLAVSLFEPGMPLEGSVVTCPDRQYEDDWIVSIGEIEMRGPTMEVRGPTFAIASARAALVHAVSGEWTRTEGGTE